MLAFNIFFVHSTSTSAAVVVPATNVVTMNGILDDALPGLLILREGIDSSRYSLALLEDGDDESEDEA